MSENGGRPSHTFDTIDEVLDAKLQRIDIATDLAAASAYVAKS